MMRTILLSGLLMLAAPAALGSGPFPRPPELEPAVYFWTRVYTEVETSGGLIHDSRNLGVVYEVVQLSKGLSSRGRERHTEKIKRRYRNALIKLSQGRRSGLSAFEQRTLGLWPDGVSNQTLRAAASRVRFQLGQADKFRAGLVRSGRWEPHIRKTFSDMGLPVELAALPHVESSYTPYAKSRVGAAGLWQFTRSTGRRFMRVDHVVDERLDPFIATVAAARLLKQNREVTGSWPLAVTAYNHGASGMRRAVRKLGTRDIATIIRDYRSRTFGFASRNFYVEFLAAAEVDFHSEKYFGTQILDPPGDDATHEVPYYVLASNLEAALGVDLSVLKRANPALLPSVWQGSKYVPKGFTLRVPRASLSRPLDTLIQEVPSSQRVAAQKRDTYHRVRRGENLSNIARRYRVRVSDLVALNGLRSRHRIRAGQRLRLPDDGRGPQLASAAPRTSDPIAPPADGLYRVRRGDTLEGIGERFGLKPQDLASGNQLRNRNRIYVGQTLRIGPETNRPSHADPVEVAPPAPHTIPREETESVAKAPAREEPELSDQRRALAADPSDYSVDANDRVEVQTTETLGHYAEWLEIRASRLRRLNRMEYGTPLGVGKKIRLDFSQVSKETFEVRRSSHHRDIQEEFFERYEISGTTEHVMRSGDSLWILSQRAYRVPIWLIRQYNPDLDFGSLHAGTRLTIPRVRPHAAQSS